MIWIIWTGSKEIILHMGQNKITYIDVNITTGYCANCLKNLDDIDKSDKWKITKDHNNNEFCDKECKCQFSRENREEIDDIVNMWFG